MWLCNCSLLNFLIYEENFLFFFISVLDINVTYEFDVDDACLVDEVVAIVPAVHQVDGGQQVGRIQRSRLDKPTNLIGRRSSNERTAYNTE